MADAKTQVERERAEISALLRKLGGASPHRHEKVKFEGNEVVLPEDTDIPQNIAFLQNVMREDGEYAEWFRSFKFRPEDGQVALDRAMDQVFGGRRHKGATTSFFGMQFTDPPRYQSVAVSAFEKIEVPILGSELSVAKFPEITIVPHAYHDEEYGDVFALKVSGLKKLNEDVQGLFNLVGQFLQEGSIYKGQAIDGNFNFIDLSGIDPAKLVFADEVLFDLKVSVWGPIQHQEAFTRDGVTVKGATLLFGPWGTGKTSLLHVTGQIATEQNWTYILVRQNQDLFTAFKFGELYSPVLIAFEDVDVLTQGAEADRVKNILELFDGAREKGVPIRAVLTTNHPEQIHAGMLRPGRIDKAIEVGAPDGPAIRRLVELNTPHLNENISEDEWAAVIEAMDSYLPAFVIEATKEAYTAAVIRETETGETLMVDWDDLRKAANGLRGQWKLQQGAAETAAPDSFKEILRNTIRPVVEETLVEMLDPRIVRQNGTGH